MSAKEFYHKDVPPNLPYVPPELWTSIIQHATWVPGGYDPELTTLALGVSASTMNKERLDKWKKALVTRRSLVLVNKAWFILASPFLYEYVLLGRGKAIAPLLQGMQRTKQDVNADDTCPLGWWTKRLDVNLRDSTDAPWADIDALADIMTHLPNLRVLTFSITGHRYLKRSLSPKVLWSISCRDTLKHVHFYTICLPSAEAFTLFLEKHPYLESVNLNEISKGGYPHTVQLDSLQMVHIHAFHPVKLVPKENFPNVWDFDLPAVHIATYELEFMLNLNDVIEQIFTKHGPKLNTIQLTQIYQISDMELDGALKITFDHILAYCHNLEQINFIFYEWWMLMLSLTIVPFRFKASTLVIRVIRGQISKKLTCGLFREFALLKIRSPNLKTIQFASQMNARGVRMHSAASADGIWALSMLGVVIIDHEGSVMQ